MGIGVLDKSGAVSYYPSLNAVTGDITATILLSRIIYWWEKDKKKFFKFRGKCSHEFYRPGDSWIEELGISGAQFDRAIRLIGTKKKAGSKQYQGDVVDATSATRLVTYWTDKSRLTWYSLDEELLGNLILMNSKVIHETQITLEFMKDELPLYREDNNNNIDIGPLATPKRGRKPKAGQPELLASESLSATTESAIYLFTEVLPAAYLAIGRRAPSLLFPDKRSKERFESVELLCGSNAMNKRIQAAVRNGVLDKKAIVAYVTSPKWDENSKKPQKPSAVQKMLEGSQNE